jgi:hypothetical protein
MKYQQGVSLLSTLIAVSVLGLLSLSFGRYITNSMRAQSHIELRAEKKQLQDYLSARTSCPETLPDAKCLPDEPMAVIGKEGREIVSAVGSLLGNFKVTAVCSQSGEEVSVFVQLVSKGGQPRIDPLTRKKYKKNSAETQLYKYNGLCFGKSTAIKVEGAYCGATEKLTAAELGGYRGVREKCEIACGVPADICSDDGLMKTRRAGITIYPQGQWMRYLGLQGFDDGLANIGDCERFQTAESSSASPTFQEYFTKGVSWYYLAYHTCNAALRAACCKL